MIGGVCLYGLSSHRVCGDLRSRGGIRDDRRFWFATLLRLTLSLSLPYTTLRHGSPFNLQFFCFIDHATFPVNERVALLVRQHLRLSVSSTLVCYFGGTGIIQRQNSDHSLVVQTRLRRYLYLLQAVSQLFYLVSSLPTPFEIHGSPLISSTPLF